MREAMPLTAELVDELRQVFGAGRIVALIAHSQHLRREHARIVATQGQAVADRWLAGQQDKGGWFGAVEGGRQVGVLTVGGRP